MVGKTIETLQVEEKARFGKTISESDTYLYVGITGDEPYARETFFKTRIAYGMLCAGLISTVLVTIGQAGRIAKCKTRVR